MHYTSLAESDHENCRVHALVSGALESERCATEAEN